MDTARVQRVRVSFSQPIGAHYACNRSRSRYSARHVSNTWRVLFRIPRTSYTLATCRIMPRHTQRIRPRSPQFRAVVLHTLVPTILPTRRNDGAVSAPTTSRARFRSLTVLARCRGLTASVPKHLGNASASGGIMSAHCFTPTTNRGVIATVAFATAAIWAIHVVRRHGDATPN